ncbi:MAG TPA: O-acetyl-ADP-ribose deacetylase [Blastocatellia bacterium]|nr:O-acetyl-ADP-ribose deacetylase [Blastocatellia bacterium]
MVEASDQFVFLNGRVTALQGDITAQAVDAIVNAANWTLLGGGGVDGAIHEEGGPGILEACKEIRRTLYPDGLPTGEAVITTAGNLPARYVIHTVGPIKGRYGDKDADYLAACYRNSLKLAFDYGVTTIAFPAISTGVYGYPKDEAAAVSSKAIAEFLADDTQIKEVRLVFYSTSDLRVFSQYHCFG